MSGMMAVDGPLGVSIAERRAESISSVILINIRAYPLDIFAYLLDVLAYLLDIRAYL
jgi:hypothetical protein